MGFYSDAGFDATELLDLCFHGRCTAGDRPGSNIVPQAMDGARGSLRINSYI